MKPHWKVVMSLALVFGIMAVGFSPAAHAVPMLRLTSGSDVITVADGSLDDTSAVPGVVGFSGVVGSFTTSATAGITKPLIGTEDDPNLSLASIETSDAGGTLTIEFTDTDFSAPGPGGFDVSIGGTTEGTVSYMTYRDTGNVAFATSELLTILGPFTPLPFDDTTSTGVTAAGGPYSLTLVVEITHPTGKHVSSFGADLVPNPEPGTMLLFGTGLLGMLGYGWRRRKQAA